ncbi:CRISPR-associated protein Cas5 [Palleniella muris]|uniref:CRISPR-associated protein Cas5 n=1 Tax=Palleniella muris TaxID=3038145 RepID=A0AC61QP26_9BACT|nr:CRISPR-associated protein Cas5 [Palleniella muris]
MSSSVQDSFSVPTRSAVLA